MTYGRCVTMWHVLLRANAIEICNMPFNSHACSPVAMTCIMHLRRASSAPWCLNQVAISSAVMLEGSSSFRQGSVPQGAALQPEPALLSLCPHVLIPGSRVPFVLMLPLQSPLLTVQLS